jgi:hypothetical protein
MKCKAAALAVAAVSLLGFLPFARGLLGGGSFFFRDLAGQFFPFRSFALEGLLRGDLRYWNPYAYQGVPVSLPPVGYPLDLLQLLQPTSHGISLVLALHVPLAGITLLLLARSLGLTWPAAALGGVVYMLGGFSLSALNLYVYAQALAWAPLVALTLRRAREGGRHRIAWAALATALAVSTTGLEVVAQAVLLGLLLARPGLDPRPWLRLGAALGLAAGLSTAVVFTVLDGMPGSERAAGFSSDVVLAHSVHPISLLQTVIGNLHGDLTSFTDRFWGMNFFARGYPYVLSLYLGAGVLALALAGLLHTALPRRVLAGLGLLALLLSLGRYVGLEPLVEALPALRIFRYPVKAFFTVHLLVAVLAAAGLDALMGREATRAWRRLAFAALVPGSVLVALLALPTLAPATTRLLVSGFFPPDAPWAWRADRAVAILHDAAVGGAVAMSVGFVAVAVVRRGLSPATGAWLVAGLLAADLLRTGAGLNPMVTPSFFSPSPEMAPVVERLRREGARVFTCDPHSSRSFQAAQRAAVLASQPHEARTFAVLTDTLTPFHNMSLGVPAVLGLDRTMLVPTSRVFTPEEASCDATPRFLERVRAAGASHLIRLDPLDHSELRLQEVIEPARIAPLRVHVYALQRPRPRAAVVARDTAEATAASDRVLSLRESPGRIEVSTETARAAVIVVGEAWAPGWSATVNHEPRPVIEGEGRSLAVAIDAGRSEVRFTYRPPRLWLGAALTLLSAFVVAGLLVRPRSHATEMTV